MVTAKERQEQEEREERERQQRQRQQQAAKEGADEGTKPGAIKRADQRGTREAEEGSKTYYVSKEFVDKGGMRHQVGAVGSFPDEEVQAQLAAGTIQEYDPTQPQTPQVPPAEGEIARQARQHPRRKDQPDR